MNSYFSSIRIAIILITSFLFVSCHSSRRISKSNKVSEESNATIMIPTAHNSENHIAARRINTKNVDPAAVVYFAKTLVGVPYKYGSAKKEEGFDCSGFISYVFNHFNISVPRTSVEFTNAGTSIPFIDCRLGDLILFTGTDKTGWIVGHMGIITENQQGKIKFIHSASGNNRGVMISELSDYFFTRFVKIVRVFNNS